MAHAADRISYLPPDITDHILQCLPLRDAVRSSTLSTHWRFKWHRLPQLILDDSFFSSIKKLNKYSRIIDGVSSSEILDVAMLEYSNIVNTILLCHDGPIHKIVIGTRWFRKDADISHWFHFASRKLIKEFSYHGTQKLPPWMFSCVEFNHLTHLTLINCKLPSVPRTFRGFPCLVSLEINFMHEPSDDEPSDDENASKLGIIVSKCPLLENLNLTIFECESCLTINAPKLQNLVVDGWLSNIFLEGTERINVLTFDVELDYARDPMMEFFSCLPVVKKLIVGSNFWGIDEEPFVYLVDNNNPNKLRELKYLVLDRVFIDCQYDHVLCFLKMAPKLQILEINMAAGNGDNGVTVVGGCSLQHLRSVTLNFFALGNSSDGFVLQLVQMILSSSPVLEVMTIEASFLGYDKFNVAEKVMQYSRASANAKIIVYENDG